MTTPRRGPSEAYRRAVLSVPGELAHGVIERRGQRIAWQEFGSGENVVLLLPTWSIVHSDFWRWQVPHLAADHRVIAFDGLGNGASDRPEEPEYYGDLPFAEDAV